MAQPVKQRRYWEIPGLSTEKDFRRAADCILSHRVSAVIALAHDFKMSHHTEDLHQLRIVIRRLRYPLETLLSQYKRKLVLSFLQELNKLQEGAGNARDLDVMLERFESERNGIQQKFLDELRTQRSMCYNDAEDRIDLFLVSPVLYDFKRAIKYDKFQKLAQRRNNRRTQTKIPEESTPESNIQLNSLYDKEDNHD